MNSKQRLIEDSYTSTNMFDYNDQELEDIAQRCGVRWEGNYWIIEDADLHPFMRTIINIAREGNT